MYIPFWAAPLTRRPCRVGLIAVPLVEGGGVVGLFAQGEGSVPSVASGKAERVFNVRKREPPGLLGWNLGGYYSVEGAGVAVNRARSSSSVFSVPCQ